MRKFLLITLLIINSIVASAQDCPSINGWIKTSSSTSLGSCEANVAASVSTQSIFSGETIAINLTSSKPGTTFSWTVLQTGVSGGNSGSGAIINQTLNSLNSVDGTATYTITPTLGSCNGTPITVIIIIKPLFKNVLKSAAFAKNNCASGGTGSTITYTVPAGTYSESSQTAADEKAQQDISLNGQNYANTKGSCTFKNIAVSGTFRKRNCAGGEGSLEIYSVPAGTYTAASQAEADFIAQTAVNNNGQNYANTNGYCTYRASSSRSFTKNNCPTGRIGSVVSFSAEATSFISVEDAGAKAIAAVNAGGQANANALGTCTLPTRLFYYKGIYPTGDTRHNPNRDCWVKYIDRDGVERTFYTGPVENGCRQITAASIVDTNAVDPCSP